MKNKLLLPGSFLMYFMFTLFAVLSSKQAIYAQYASANVSAGANPNGIAVNPITNKIYVANYGSGNVTVIDGADNSTALVSTGTNPYAIALNPVTNKIYVSNQNSNNVTVIDGADNSTTLVSAGITPFAIALNPVTNKIYVANNGSGNVTVIDGTNNSSAAVSTGSDPCAIAVNPVTNKIYVVNQGSDNVTVIDGATNSTATVSTGSIPFAITVNPVTNKIYIVNQGSNDVTIIDGATNSTTAVSTGSTPFTIAVNPVTNKIYAANYGSNNVTVIDGTANSTATVITGTEPRAIAVNPVTNKIYVANNGSGNVTVIDGANNTTAAVSAGTNPNSVEVNPVTNKIYVANTGSNNVTVIDVITNSTATVSAGMFPYAIALNPVTNKIYVANNGSGNVTVIDGADNSTTLVSAGITPFAIALNPVTNKIYVANNGSGNVTVIDGTNNSSAAVSTGSDPCAIAVNPVTNKIYVVNQGSDNVTVIDGATNSTATVSTGSIPCAIAVNPVTNKIYIVNQGSNDVTIIDGITNSTATIAAGSDPCVIAVNPVTNKIYVVNHSSNDVTIIDGATNSTTALSAGSQPNSIAVNPVTNKIYVVNLNSYSVTVIDEQEEQSIPLNASITALPNHTTTSTTPVFSITASSSYTPAAPPISGVYYTIDTWQNGWQKASGTGPFTAELSTLSYGTHILYAYAVDGMDATSINTGFGLSPIIGSIKAYPFTVLPSVTAESNSLITSFTPGTAVPAANIVFSSLSGAALITSIKVDRTGTAANTDVPTAELWIDRNSNNIVDGGDTQLGTTQSFSGTPASVTFTGLSYYPVSTENLLVIYNVAGEANTSATAGLYMNTDYITGQPGSTTVTFAGVTTGTEPLPVELTSFTAAAQSDKVILNWQTATEVNNYGFQVERQVGSMQNAVGNQNNPQWELVGFVEGNGNSNSPKQYSFVDNLSNLEILSAGSFGQSCNLQYRLKQVDTDGKYEYFSQIAEVNYSLTDVKEKQLPAEFALEQNYPNPFNPVTTISYQVPVGTCHGMFVQLKIFDVLGNEIVTLVNEVKVPGYYNVKFDASNLPTGVYIYRLSAGNFVSTKKLMLLK